MRDQSQEIYDYIRAHPGHATQDIVDGTGWNRHLVEKATDLMVAHNLIAEVGRDEWGDPQFEIIVPRRPTKGGTS